MITRIGSKERKQVIREGCMLVDMAGKDLFDMLEACHGTLLGRRRALADWLCDNLHDLYQENPTAPGASYWKTYNHYRLAFVIAKQYI